MMVAYQHQCSPYPEVVGEGEVTSLLLPDGSVQLYFLPVKQWSAPTYKCSMCNPHRIWFIRSVSNLTPHPMFSVPPQVSCIAPCANPFGSYATPLPPPPTTCPCAAPYQIKFHYDACTSSTDLHYFSPLQSRTTKANAVVQIKSPTEDKTTETDCTTNEQPCSEKATRKKSREHVCKCSSYMSIVDKKERQRTKRQEKKYKKQQEREIKRRSRDKRRKSKNDHSGDSNSSTGGSDMSIDDSSSWQYSSYDSSTSATDDSKSQDKKDKSKNRSKTKVKEKKESKDSCGVCESCLSKDKKDKESKSNEKKLKKNYKTKSAPKESKTRNHSPKAGYSKAPTKDGWYNWLCGCDSNGGEVRKKERGIVIRDYSPPAANQRCQTAEQYTAEKLVATSGNDTTPRLHNGNSNPTSCPCDEAMLNNDDKDLEMWLSKWASDFSNAVKGDVSVSEID